LASLSFSFVSRAHFADRNPHRYILPPGQAQTIYTKSKVINDIAVGNNNTIVNKGIGYERIAAASRDEIRKVVVRDLPANGGKTGKPDRIEKEGSSLVVYRPQIHAQTPAQNALAPTRAQQEVRKDFGAAAQPNTHMATQGHAVPNSSLPFASSKPIAVTSISSRDEQALVKTRTDLPAATSTPRQFPTPQMGKAITERGLKSQGGSSATLPQPVNKPEPIYRNQSVPSESPRTTVGPQIVRPINERGTRSQGAQSAFAAPANSRPQPVITVPAQPRYSAPSQTAPQTVYQPPQQPYVVGQPRQEIQRQAPAVRSYAEPQVVPQQAYRPPPTAPTYSAPSIAIPTAPQRYYSPPPTAQPAYRPAPVYNAPARAAPVQAPRAQPQQAAPARRESDKK
jgi:hypothetical protein